MEPFKEYYRLHWFAKNIADGSFSYLWYSLRCTWEKA